MGLWTISQTKGACAFVEDGVTFLPPVKRNLVSLSKLCTLGTRMTDGSVGEVLATKA